jgi:hypothetical protein
MSKSLLRQAANRMEGLKTAAMRKRAENKKEEEVLFSGVGSLAGAGGGAFIDTKGQNGGPHKLFVKTDGTGGFPTNIAIGVPLAVAAIAIKKFPAKAPVAALGLSLVGVGLYRYIVDKHAANAAANPPA